MITFAKFPESITRRTLLALTALGHISITYADNPPPCDPCKIELAPSADPTHLKATVGVAKKAGLKGWEIPVTWNTMDVPHGAYTPECDNIDHQGLQAFDGWYVPTTMTKTFYMNSGTTRFAMSDNFYARYFDPCKGGPYKSGGSTYNMVKVKAPTPPPTDPNDPPGDPPGGGGGGDGGGDPPILPPHVDPHQGGEETHDPCPPGPFVPQECSPFQNPDTRVAADLPEPSQVEIVAENIAFNHVKNGFLQYNYDPATVPVPKYFLEEYAETVLDGGIQETPVGGSIARRVCPMTGELIVTQMEGNPSWYGVRSGPNVTITETTASGSFDVSSYDDCPNQVNDTPAVMMFASELADEYTKERMRDDAFHHAWEFKGEGFFRQGEAYAQLLINQSEDKVEYTKTKYKIRIPDYLPRPYHVSWVEEFTPEDTNPDDDQVPEKQYITKSATINGNESGVYTIDPQQTLDKEGVWRVRLLMVNALVDYNRDLSISFDGSDLTKPTKPHRFWINDDRDELHVVDAWIHGENLSGIYEEDDVESDEKTLADCDDGGLLYLRDLEDLDRIHVDYTAVANAMTMMGLSDGNIMIKARMEAVQGSPSLNLFTAFELDGGRKYLEASVADQDPEGSYPPAGEASQQLSGAYASILATVTCGNEVIVNDYNKNARGHNFKMALLYEGKTSGKGNLYFDVYVNGLKWGSSSPIHLDLKPVSTMYETWTVGHAEDPGTPYGNESWPKSIPEPDAEWDLPEPESEAEKDYTLLVHGWNCSKFEKRVYFGDTQFKRMWQLGYKGRFGSFTWPTFWNFPIPPTVALQHFNGSEERAWNSAPGLKWLIEDRNAAGFHVRLNGHSMGNIVCSEALRLFNGTAPVHTYISQQAAISAHAWDPSTRTVIDRDSVDIPDIYGEYWQPGLSHLDVRTWGAASSKVSYHSGAYQNPDVEYINHWNFADWALKQFVVNNRLKPTRPEYGYSPEDGTIFQVVSTSPSAYTTMYFPTQRYKGFAWAAKSYSYPTGAEGNTRGCFDKDESYDLTDYFKGEHPGHSAQWRSSIHRRVDYWRKFINQMSYAK